MLYTGTSGSIPTPPAFDPATNRVWVVCRSRYARYDNGSIVRDYGAEPGKLDPDTGNYTLFATDATKGSGPHLIGDEEATLSVDAWGFLTGSWGTLGYIRHNPETAYHVVSSMLNDGYAHPSSPLVYTGTSGAWPDKCVQAGGGSHAAAAVAQNSIFWAAEYGLVVRLARQ